jgi:hypothetical protein
MGTSALAAVLRGAAVSLSEGRRRCGASVGSAGGERGEIVWLFVTLGHTNKYPFINRSAASSCLSEGPTRGESYKSSENR